MFGNVCVTDGHGHIVFVVTIPSLYSSLESDMTSQDVYNEQYDGYH